MGVIREKWRCPTCNTDVGGSMGELRNHMKRVHVPATSKTQVAEA